ncbi:ABC transporter substrate-binding protein [Embleya sp. AB8]|uniref:ABC transporter substrate-binding protein n=1 Tax=Embleya sp. AB8 TaxID=3156304 RepID=UPI003C73EC87
MSKHHGDNARKRAAALAGASVLALTLAACGGGDGAAGGKADPSASAGGKKGGNLTLLTVSDARSMTPFNASYAAVTDLNRMLAVYDALFYVDNTQNTVVPQIGKSLKSDDGGKTWTLEVKPNVKFSDGTPLDAAAVKFNWEMHAKPEVLSQHRPAASGLGLEVVDPLTLRITLPMLNANFDRTVATELSYIESPKQYGIDPKGERPVGAGPFVLKTWTRDSQMVFEKNPNYWQGADKPYLDTLTIKVVNDVKQQVDTIKAGGADITFTIDAQKTKAAQEAGLGVTPFTLDGGQMIVFNTATAPFDDPRARRAVALALDPADLNQKMFAGTATPAKSIFHSGKNFTDPTAVQPSPNKAEAQQLFDQLAAEGKPVKFGYLVPENPTSNATSEYTMTALNAFKNVEVKLDKAEVSSYYLRLTVQKNFSAALYQIWSSDPEPVLFNSLFSQTPLNFTGYRSQEADAALLKGRSTTDESARKAAYADLQKVLVKDLPMLAYQEAVTNIISGSRAAGVVGVQDGGMLMDRVGLK